MVHRESKVRWSATQLKTGLESNPSAWEEKSIKSIIHISYRWHFHCQKCRVRFFFLTCGTPDHKVTFALRYLLYLLRKFPFWDLAITLVHIAEQKGMWLVGRNDLFPLLCVVCKFCKRIIGIFTIGCPFWMFSRLPVCSLYEKTQHSCQ